MEKQSTPSDYDRDFLLSFLELANQNFQPGKASTNSFDGPTFAQRVIHMDAEFSCQELNASSCASCAGKLISLASRFSTLRHECKTVLWS